MQQATTLLNALIGCIPIGGATSANIIRGGAGILNDLQVCELVELALGIAKDASDGFRSDQVLDFHLRNANKAPSI